METYMASSSTRRILVNSKGQRTNSLGYAKHDCHTCFEQKRKCDRQRPRCGPCLSKRERCGGFAMNLVWKDVGTTPNSQARVTGRFLDEEPLNVNTPAYPPSRASRGFKFVRGQMKKKRKPKDVPALRGEPSPTNLADTYGLNKTSNQPEMTTWSTCPIFRESDPLNIITESVDEINYCYEGELANELSEPGEHEPISLRALI